MNYFKYFLSMQWGWFTLQTCIVLILIFFFRNTNYPHHAGNIVMQLCTWEKLTGTGRNGSVWFRSGRSPPWILAAPWSFCILNVMLNAFSSLILWVIKNTPVLHSCIQTQQPVQLWTAKCHHTSSSSYNLLADGSFVPTGSILQRNVVPHMAGNQ